METPTTTRPADLYLTNCRIRAEIPMLAFSRLSDVLNNIPGLFLHGELIGIDAIDGALAPPDERNFVVRLHDVLFVCPLGAAAVGPSPATSTAERRDRLQQSMVVQLDGWRISGSLHLVDHIRWVDFATAANTRFIAVTNATIFPPGAAAPFECPFLLVNGARMSALYEQAAA
jgi:hypothetical protein